jgi:hypothetical protein
MIIAMTQLAYHNGDAKASTEPNKLDVNISNQASLLASGGVWSEWSLGT